jgi:hypothetical protein
MSTSQSLLPSAPIVLATNAKMQSTRLFYVKKVSIAANSGGKRSVQNKSRFILDLP